MTEELRTKRQQKTRLVFMNAFVRLVLEHGFDRISVTDIADEANYGRWAFYQYFKSKEAVAWATFEHWMTELDTAILEAVQRFESPRREYESWRIIFHAMHEQRGFWRRLESVLVSEWRVRAKEYLVQQFLGHIHHGHFVLMAGVRPEISARLYVVALLELLEYWAQHPELGETEALADEFFTFIFNQPPPKNNT